MPDQPSRQQQSSPNEAAAASGRSVMSRLQDAMAQIEDSMNRHGPFHRLRSSRNDDSDSDNNRTAASNPNGSNAPSDTPPNEAAAVPGHVSFSSIGSALSSLRRQVDDLMMHPVGRRHHEGSTPPSPSRASSQDPSQDPSVRQLSARLDMAELAHSTRTPLEHIESALERRNQRTVSVGSAVASDGIRYSPSFSSSPAASSAAAAAASSAALCSQTLQDSPPHVSSTAANAHETLGSAPDATRHDPQQTPVSSKRRPSQTMASRSHSYSSMAGTRSDMDRILEQDSNLEQPHPSAETADNRTESPPRQRQRRGSIGNGNDTNTDTNDRAENDRNDTARSRSSSPPPPPSLPPNAASKNMTDDERIHRQLSASLDYLSEDEGSVSPRRLKRPKPSHRPSHPTVDDSGNAVEVVLPPILLSRASSDKLTDDHRSVLFGSSSAASSIADDMSTGDLSDGEHHVFVPPVYSWGIDIDRISLHDTVNSKHNDDGDNGNGNHQQSSTTDTTIRPVSSSDRIGRTHVMSVSTNQHHSAIVTRSGSVLTCGSNKYGAVDPLQPQSQVFPKPRLLECLQVPVLQVSCGFDHIAALTNTGTVLTWGNNAYGQLGHRVSPTLPKKNSGSSATLSPVGHDHDVINVRPPQIMALGQRRAASVACGEGFTLVLTSRMQLLACGKSSIAGYGHQTASQQPQQSFGNRVNKNESNGKDGYTFGDFEHHELPATLPTLFGLPIIQISAGRHHAMVVTSNGRAFVWGDNEYGQCGQQYPKQLNASPVAIRLPALATTKTVRDVMPAEDAWIVSAACGDTHSLLISKSGVLYAFGSNTSGQLGVRTASHVNDKAAGTNNIAGQIHRIDHPDHGHFVTAVAGQSHSLALDSDQNVWHFGNDSPMKLVLKDQGITMIAAGSNHCVAVGSVPVTDLPPMLPKPLSPSKRQLSNLLQESIIQQQQTTDTTTRNEPTVETTMEDLVTAMGREMVVADAQPQVSPAAKELASRAQELFKTPSVLNSLFWEPSDLDVLYSKIMSTSSHQVRQMIASAMEKGMMEGLESLEHESGQLRFPESVRFLLLYLQCPFFLQEEQQKNKDSRDDSDDSADVTDESPPVVFDRRGDLMLLLCETFLGLSYEGYQAMVSWVTTLYPRPLFVKYLVQPLLQQLTKGLKPDAGAAQRLIPLVTTVLRWLYIISERAGGIALPEDFYSTAVANRDVQSAYNDLRRWKDASKAQRSSNFYLCANSFLFSPSSKRSLLSIENQVEMFSSAATNGVFFDPINRTLHINMDPYFVVEIEREKLLSQTLEKISHADSKDLRKRLKVKFKGEEGVDAGGVTREFFQLLSAQLFDVSSGMWTDKYGSDVTWFNSDCFWNDEGYYLVGILVGLAVYNDVLLDVNFPGAVYRKLLGMPLGLEDLMDDELRRSFQSLLDYDPVENGGASVEDVFCLSFDLQWHDLGSEKTVELKCNGSNIAVTEENREEYVQLYVKFLLEDSVYPQYEAFERGFMKIMSNSTLDFIKPEELELLVVGTRDLDFTALRERTEYEGGYTKDSAVVQHLWRFLESSPSETQRHFLKFATGTDRAPIGGLRNLKFKIQRAGPDSMQLPTSHTCFNTLLLPDYGDNYEKVRERMGRAVLENEGFGLQ